MSRRSPESRPSVVFVMGNFEPHSSTGYAIVRKTGPFGLGRPLFVEDFSKRGSASQGLVLE